MIILIFCSTMNIDIDDFENNIENIEHSSMY